MSDHGVAFRAGDPILYVPDHAHGESAHPDCEEGFIVQVTGDLAWCRFFRRGTRELRTVANEERTPIANLELRPDPRLAEQERDIKWLRRALAIAYAGISLYTDDGELQDGREGPPIDFKRDPVSEIERKMGERTARWLAGQRPDLLASIEKKLDAEEEAREIFARTRQLIEESMADRTCSDIRRVLVEEFGAGAVARADRFLPERDIPEVTQE